MLRFSAPLVRVVLRRVCKARHGTALLHRVRRRVSWVRSEIHFDLHTVGRRLLLTLNGTNELITSIDQSMRRVTGQSTETCSKEYINQSINQSTELCAWIVIC